MEQEQRKEWNRQHKVLNEIIGKPGEHNRAVVQFLALHEWLYPAEMSGCGFSYEDALLEHLEEGTFRAYPAPSPDTENSIAWHLWHLARVEDITMNLLVAGRRQVLHDGNWPGRLGISFEHSGNGMGKKELAELSTGICREELRAYRIAVGRQTRRIIASLEPGAFREKVQRERVKRLFEEGAVLPEARWLADYWAQKTLGGLVLMPATRHHLVHLNRCAQIKQRLQGGRGKGGYYADGQAVEYGGAAGEPPADEGPGAG